MRSWSVLLVIGVALGACSNEKAAKQEGAPADKKRDACVFLTLDDVQQAYGPVMKKSTDNRSFSGPSNDLGLCTYEGGDPLHVATMMVTWTNSPTGNLMASRDAYVAAAEKENEPSLKCEKLDFQGLPAVWQAGQLKVWKTGVMLSILADAAPGKTAKETMELLMAKAITRM